MDPKAMEPYGMALLDFLSGDRSGKLIVRRDDGFTGDQPVGHFFRRPEDFSPIDRSAIELCHGRVLDVGAGTGCHSLVLQDKGVLVTAIDVSPQAVRTMLQRGVKEVHCADVFEYSGGPFDTLLMMDHGIGLVECLSGLDHFLGHAFDLLSPAGQILLDSLDVRQTDDPKHKSYQEGNRQAGRYVGEIRMRLEYKRHVGPFLGWLHVDPDTLTARARTAGWSCEVGLEEESGDYLAQLSSL